MTETEFKSLVSDARRKLRALSEAMLRVDARLDTLGAIASPSPEADWSLVAGSGELGPLAQWADGARSRLAADSESGGGQGLEVVTIEDVLRLLGSASALMTELARVLYTVNRTTDVVQGAVLPGEAIDFVAADVGTIHALLAQWYRRLVQGLMHAPGCTFIPFTPRE